MNQPAHRPEFSQEDAGRFFVCYKMPLVEALLDGRAQLDGFNRQAIGSAETSCYAIHLFVFIITRHLGEGVLPFVGVLAWRNGVSPREHPNKR